MIFRFGIKGRKWNAVFSFGNTKTQLVSALFFSYSFYFIEKYFMHFFHSSKKIKKKKMMLFVFNADDRSCYFVDERIAI